MPRAWLIALNTAYAVILAWMVALAVLVASLLPGAVTVAQAPLFLPPGEYALTYHGMLEPRCRELCPKRTPISVLFPPP